MIGFLRNPRVEMRTDAVERCRDQTRGRRNRYRVARPSRKGGRVAQRQVAAPCGFNCNCSILDAVSTKTHSPMASHFHCGKEDSLSSSSSSCPQYDSKSIFPDADFSSRSLVSRKNSCAAFTIAAASWVSICIWRRCRWHVVRVDWHIDKPDGDLIAYFDFLIEPFDVPIRGLFLHCGTQFRSKIDCPVDKSSDPQTICIAGVPTRMHH